MLVQLLKRVCSILGVSVVLWSCSEPSLVARTIVSGNPPLLSDWGQVGVLNNRVVLADAVEPYDLASSLFTDYAHKLRTVWMPPGTAAVYRSDDVLEFPLGTVITKTFYYPRTAIGDQQVRRAPDTSAQLLAGELGVDAIRLIETRILVRRESGWAAIPYRWNEEQTDATLQRAGDIVPLTMVTDTGVEENFSYWVPNVNQCSSCHGIDAKSRALHPIGPKVRHLNKRYHFDTAEVNQLDRWVTAGILEGAPASSEWGQNVDWADPEQALTARARAYLDINCSHCHSKQGPANTSGLHLDPATPLGPAFGLCKLPIAAGKGTGNRSYDIVPGRPDDSILVHRLESTIPDVMMPEIGRALRHTEAVSMIRDWVLELDGGCTTG